jgi:hypothetical protein
MYALSAEPVKVPMAAIPSTQLELPLEEPYTDGRRQYLDRRQHNRALAESSHRHKTNSLNLKNI